MTTKTGRPSLSARLTAQAWFQLVLAAMVLVVIIGTVAGAQVIAQTNRVTDRLLDKSLPAAAEAYRLQSALVDQETGVRGYGITADPQFLQPYRDGTRDEAQSAARLRELLAGRRPLLDELDGVEQAAQRWRTEYAEPLVAGLQSGSTRGIEPTTPTRGKPLFDDLRTRFDAQNSNLAAAIARDEEELAHSRTVRDAVLAGMVVAFLLTGVLLTVLIRRLIVRPLGSLTDASLRVAGGDFEHHIDAHGPADLATVANAVESMRRRIVAELASSRAKEAVLAEQKTDLDVQAEELRRSNAELEQFAYVASHDLQEPLRKVASFCQLLEKRYGDKLDERGKQYIDFAVDGAKRMQVLINDLLTFSRVGRVTDRTVPTDVGQSLDKALTNLSAAIDETETSVRRPDQLPEIIGDPTLLTMLWQNLIANAIKFRRPDRAPRIEITCEPDEHGNGWLLSVSDNGIGIAPEFAEKVFVIFQRLHNREEYSGTGIGLAVCKKIVEYHGGRIWIDTEYTGGARFWFTLRTADSDSTAHTADLPTHEGAIA
ncbi:ATP-binding protein [Nocardia sp. CDC186]|uniref:histidine kinase n=1 Tax=Nocardia implantans TaxID=3108168 RepID=A0ABU6AVA3_9NOCA|nr:MULTISPECIES: sensor histidine kinase [unclassified Nocardia]MBF6192379.1 CHASE3 domain-containing protein [Nocardia beijingensis]MEA3527718.1 CHASE3 domain-containing protein [Nocardia sp. CDC192]MEB3511426.1 ATP-binding protein [Nocardia sp. CDC186]